MKVRAAEHHESSKCHCIVCTLKWYVTCSWLQLNVFNLKNMWAFCLIAVKKATWVTSSSTGAIWENSAKVLTLAGSVQTGTVWSGNTASIWATSTWRTLALLNQTNWSSLDRSFSTSTLCRNNISSLDEWDECHEQLGNSHPTWTFL